MSPLDKLLVVVIGAWLACIVGYGLVRHWATGSSAEKDEAGGSEDSDPPGHDPD